MAGGRAVVARCRWRGRLRATAECAMAVVRVEGSSRVEGKQQCVVAVVMRPVATSLEANVASGQVNGAAKESLRRLRQQSGAAVLMCIRDMQA